MEKILKATKHNQYVRVNGTLKVENIKMRVHQDLYGAGFMTRPAGTKWRLNKSQMKKILNEIPSSLWVKCTEEFDGATDMVEPVTEDYRPFNSEYRDYIIKQLDMFRNNPYRCSYDEETMEFEISCHYLATWKLAVVGVLIE